MKKRYLILCISILVIIAIVILGLLNNKKLFLKEDTILDNVPVSSDEEIIDITNETISDKDNSNIESESITETKDSTEQIQTSNENQEIIASTEVKSNVKNEDKKQLKESSSNTVEENPQEIIISNTKEETSTTPPTLKQETTPKQETTQTDSNNNTKNDTQSNTTSKEELPSNEPVDTIKRISAEELTAEKAKYLKDIQSINSNVKYKEAKRGQVFWPYRTSEIEVAIGSVTFGTVYYYVDIFVEGNQEKFKYYIDWTGEQ